MKPKNISILIVLTVAAMNLLVYQNCSKVDVTALPDAMSKSGDNVALATDEDGNLLPVDVGTPDDVIGGNDPVNDGPAPIPSPEVPAPAPMPSPGPIADNPENDDDGDDSSPMPGNPPAVENPPLPPVVSQPNPPADDGDVSTDPTVETPSEEDIVAACGLDRKTIHNVVDLAQFKDQDVNLSLLKGKTMVYSSDASISLKSLNIEVAVGRTILCGVKVDRLDVKKGRLEVYKSEIKSIGEQKGRLIVGEGSVMPAGF